MTTNRRRQSLLWYLPKVRSRNLISQRYIKMVEKAIKARKDSVVILSKHEDPVAPNLRAETCDLRTHNYAEFVHSFLLSTTSIFLDTGARCIHLAAVAFDTLVTTLVRKYPLLVVSTRNLARRKASAFAPNVPPT